MTTRRWRIHPHDPQHVSALSRAVGVPPLVAVILAARGFAEASQIRSFLNSSLSGLHDPSLLPGADEAAQRLCAAITERKPIVIYGDYDADGVCGTAILWQALKLAGAEVSYYIPHRLDEGYGLNSEALAGLASGGAAVVVTVDCGISSVAEARRARELGLELIVTDHHKFAPELPEADVLVHPRLPGSGYPFPEPSGAGVAFKLAWAVGQRLSDAKRVSPAMREFLIGAVALAAMGTVADVVPLVDENRVLVRHGLHGLRTHKNVGLRALIEAAGLTKNPSLTSEDIGFGLAPRINAAGRLGQAKLAVELLTTGSSERARQLAEHLNEQNAMRQQVERRISQEARKKAEPFLAKDAPALVLADPGWHAGVIGIVAGRLAERYHRPVILLSQAGDKAQGSGRSGTTVDLHEALHCCRELLQSYGGHAAAAGLKLDPSRIDAFRERFCDHVGRQLQDDDARAVLSIDAEVPLHLLTYQAVRSLDGLAPFGAGNPRPLLASTGIQLAAPPKTMGKAGNHLALQLAQNGTTLRAVAFGYGDRAEQLAQVWRNGPRPTDLSVAFSPMLNTFNGYSRVELQVKDWRLDG